MFTVLEFHSKWVPEDTQSVEVAMLRHCRGKTSSIAVDGNGIFSCEHRVGKDMFSVLEFHSTSWLKFRVCLSTNDDDENLRFIVNI